MGLTTAAVVGVVLLGVVLFSGQTGGVAAAVEGETPITEASVGVVRLPVAVDVVLVGLDGSGNGGVAVNAQEMMTHLDFLAKGDVVLQAMHGQADVEVETSLVYRVRHAGKEVTQRLAKAVAELGTSSSPYLHTSVVEDIISSDFKLNTPSYALYVLNPPVPFVNVVTGDIVSAANATADPTNIRSVSYWYTHEDRRTMVNNAPTGCATSLYASKKYRFAFYDMTAGPVAMGPRTIGDGIVTDTSLPRAFSTHGRALPGLVPSIAAFAQQTVHQLFLPPFHSFPLDAKPNVHVKIVVISEASGTPVLHDRDALKFSETELGQWVELLPALQQLESAVQGHTVMLSVATVTMQTCELCLLALAGGRKAESIDSGTVHEWMQRAVDPYWGLHGAFEPSRRDVGVHTTMDPATTRVVPVFVFDTPSTTSKPLLLDHQHQAVSKPDMVIAVQPGPTPVPTGWTCNGMARTLDPSHVPRAVLAGVLQTGFGVADSRTVCNPHRGVFESDLAWAVGHTPFGPFSTSTALSFGLADSYARNVVLSGVAEALTDLRSVLRHFEATGESVVDVMPRREYFAFVDTWRILHRSLDSIASATSVQHFGHALDVLPEVEAACRQLHELVHAAGSKVYVKRECPKGWKM